MTGVVFQDLNGGEPQELPEGKWVRINSSTEVHVSHYINTGDQIGHNAVVRDRKGGYFYGEFPVMEGTGKPLYIDAGRVRHLPVNRGIERG